MVLARSRQRSFLLPIELFSVSNRSFGTQDVQLRGQQQTVSEVCRRMNGVCTVHSNVDDPIFLLVKCEVRYEQDQGES